MPVTEHNSTVKIAFYNEKYCLNIQFGIVKIVKTKWQTKVLLTKKVKGLFMFKPKFDNNCATV